MEGVWIAGAADGIFDDPITDPIRLDEDYAVQQIDIKMGRQDEFSDVPTGECQVQMRDTTSAFDPAPFDSKQGGVAIRNPVTDTWHDLFRGMLDETLIGISPTQVVRDVTLNFVDWLDYFATVEMQATDPITFGDAVPPGSERYIFYEDSPVDDRIRQLLNDAGFLEASLKRIFSGNVRVQESVYSPGETILAAIDECCEAEFPGVAIRFVNKSGVFTFHGRFARFRPDVVDYDIGDWTCGDGAAVVASGYTRAQIRPELVGRRSRDRVINRALIYPQGSTDTEIRDAVREDATSITAHGVRSYTVPDLIIDESLIDGGYAGLTECELYAQHFVDQFADPQTKVQQLTFKTLRPDDPRAAANWALICGVQISDRINVDIDGTHGQELVGDYFVEGITYEIRPGPSTLDLSYPFVTMTLDVSPRHYWQNDPWEGLS